LVLGGAVAGYLAFAARSLGGLVFIALAINELVTCRRVRRPALAALALFAALALLQACCIHSDRHYLDQFRGGAGVLVAHAAWYAERAAAFWSNGHWALPAVVLAGGSLFLSALGFVAQTRRTLSLVALFAVLYLVVILLWPSYEAERYLYPLMPLWLLYTFSGLQHEWLQRRPLLRRGVLGLLLAGALVSYAGRYATLDRGPLRHGVATPGARQMFQYVSDHTPSDALVLFAKPRAMALFTRRTSAAPYVPQHDEQLLTYLHDVKASYFVVARCDDLFGRAANPELTRFLHAFVARHPRRFVAVWANRDFTVYRVEGKDEG
jgi:hypothetical protein